MTNPTNLNLKSVDVFIFVQADGLETNPKTISEQKEFTNLKDALALLESSQAPVKYLQFNHEGMTYKLYPASETGEYTVIKRPILN